MPRYTWEDAPAANGPKLAEWLRRGRLEGVRPDLFGETFARAMNRWKNGAHPSFFTVDKFLDLLGMHPIDVPDEIWDDPGHVGGQIPVTPRHCEVCGAVIYRRRQPSGELEKGVRYRQRTRCERCVEKRVA